MHLGLVGTVTELGASETVITITTVCTDLHAVQLYDVAQHEEGDVKQLRTSLSRLPCLPSCLTGKLIAPVNTRWMDRQIVLNSFKYPANLDDYIMVTVNTKYKHK